MESPSTSARAAHTSIARRVARAHAQIHELLDHLAAGSAELGRTRQVLEELPVILEKHFESELVAELLAVPAFPHSPADIVMRATQATCLACRKPFEDDGDDAEDPDLSDLIGKLVDPDSALLDELDGENITL